ncbi:hypothetical protein [Algisphaera agarilytica]|uniref:SprT-like family protein n=1 Tax=Algisphaera agarilytica TaxID=1385975 RepID=A0A7X0H7F8_9BACT|nr:hypothetical protein [Algisphaera agarilytica]MBB6429205.1 hypothetical protein [Algisphaera agarilytica]
MHLPRFKIGHDTIKTTLAKEPLEHHGHHCWGLNHSDRNLIEICPKCPPGRRLDVLLHELRHAWNDRFPRPHDDEGDADHYAAMTACILKQIMDQGGPGMLLAMEMDVLTDFDPAKFTGTLVERGLDRRHACNVCQQPVGPGSVLLTSPRPHPTLGSSMVGLAFYCDNCNHVQHWGELANTAGNPTGVCCLEPEYLTPEETRAFCERNPDKTAFHPAT